MVEVLRIIDQISFMYLRTQTAMLYLIPVANGRREGRELLRQ